MPNIPSTMVIIHYRCMIVKDLQQQSITNNNLNNNKKKCCTDNINSNIYRTNNINNDIFPIPQI